MRARLGDERSVIRFALLPTTLDDGSRLWLRFYSVRQRRTQRTLKENPFWETVGRARSRPR